MDDKELLALYEARDERAVSETQTQYGTQGRRIAMRILGSAEDAEECLNDALLKVWESVPPKKPPSIAAYLTAITRNCALNRLKADQRLMRGGGQAPAVLDELAECIPAADSVEDEFDRRCFLALLERFLETLPQERRVIFVQRYWYFSSCREIAEACGITEGKVRVNLTRMRRALKLYLEKEESL